MSSLSDSADLVHQVRSRMAELNDRTLLVSHLPWALQLNALIKAFRTPVNARFPMKKFKGNRKYAFLEFSSSSLAKEALERGMQLKFLGRTPKCEVVSQKVQNGYLNDPWIYQLNDFKLNKLMISCIPRIATVDDIRYLFPGASNVDFPNAGPDKALGSAQVEFIEAKDALAAFKTKHGVLIHGVPIIVNYCLRKKAGKRNKEERKNANGEQGENGTPLHLKSGIKNRKRSHSDDEGNGDRVKIGKRRRLCKDGGGGGGSRPFQNSESKSVKAN